MTNPKQIAIDKLVPVLAKRVLEFRNEESDDLDDFIKNQYSYLHGEIEAIIGALNIRFVSNDSEPTMGDMVLYEYEGDGIEVDTILRGEEYCPADVKSPSEYRGIILRNGRPVINVKDIKDD